MSITQIKDADFETQVLQNESLCLVDFWAQWCGPCKMLAPTLEALAPEYEKKVQFYKLNVDENPQIPTQHHIRGIPTLLLFQKGEIIDQLVGNQPKEAISEMLDKHLTS